VQIHFQALRSHPTHISMGANAGSQTPDSVWHERVAVQGILRQRSFAHVAIDSEPAILLTPQQTWSVISQHIVPLPARALPLAQALGHVLSEAVFADRDLPPADRSAMDGFAVRAADLENAPVTLQVVGEIAAGSAAAPVVAPATCARIFTGANVPPGADTVVMIESTRENGQVTFAVPERLGANILRRGESARQGSELVPAGQVLGAMHIAVCAAAGRTAVRAVRKPRVAIITTGRELLDPGMAAGVHQERDSNGPMMAAALAAGEFPVVLAVRVCDDSEVIVRTLHEALAAADAVVLSGGVSVGAYDFVPAAVTAVGARTLVHGVAMKPGKPFLFALSAKDQPIFGLPGNPLSAATGVHEFVLPALRLAAGWPEPDCRPQVRARLREIMANKPGRQRYVLATLTWASSGPEVTAVPSQSSADLAAGARADGAIVVPADARGLDAGALVDFRPWRMWP
jgi:molybdenum cofactor synthesis domain-containing protein